MDNPRNLFLDPSVLDSKLSYISEVNNTAKLSQGMFGLKKKKKKKRKQESMCFSKHMYENWNDTEKISVAPA